MPSSSELMSAEDAGWNELHALVDSLTPEEAERPGYYTEGWSASDLLAHIGSWLAAAGAVLEQIRAGTYRPEEIDVDAWNERFLQAMKDVPFLDVKAQAFASRARLLQAWKELDELTPEAAFWIGKSGAEHYAQHLPRLREWSLENCTQAGSLSARYLIHERPVEHGHLSVRLPCHEQVARPGGGVRHHELLAPTQQDELGGLAGRRFARRRPPEDEPDWASVRERGKNSFSSPFSFSA